MSHCCGARVFELKVLSTGFSERLSSSTVSKPLMCSRNSATSGYCSGKSVASKIGVKIFSSISPKWFSWPVVLYLACGCYVVMCRGTRRKAEGSGSSSGCSVTARPSHRLRHAPHPLRLYVKVPLDPRPKTHLLRLSHSERLRP